MGASISTSPVIVDDVSLARNGATISIKDDGIDLDKMQELNIEAVGTEAGAVERSHAEANTQGSKSIPALGSFPIEKRKQITINKAGEYTVSMDTNAGGLSTVNARVYKNGSPVGVLHANSSGTWSTYTDDLVFDEGDTCELWISASTTSGGGDIAFWRNFQVHYELNHPDQESGTVDLDT